MKASAVVFLATCSSAAAFVPSASQSSSSTQLQAELGRREALGGFAAALSAAVLFPDSSSAAYNPALQTFKGRTKT
eukprot:CAMPEP_0197269572 /NCGR_PEP_ID=MMETSP1432-20130617/5675_1 /TAXON_ID=44447 /ORGANISM="Pseudo-nitzschia delicatissima, Strain UNC1205" /LENGTH=75 /DNA_ID=CAMNT_0042734751 /DNA_START=26 /DNA_END=249 /DNA_ORIENTATION=+